MPRKKLKLFVWEGVLTNYTSGMMVALAYDVEQARSLLLELEDLESVRQDIRDEPQVVTEPRAFLVWGGG